MSGFAGEPAPTETSRPVQNVRDVGGASAPMAAGPLCLFAAEAAPTILTFCSVRTTAMDGGSD